MDGVAQVLEVRDLRSQIGRTYSRGSSASSELDILHRRQVNCSRKIFETIQYAH